MNSVLNTKTLNSVYTCSETTEIAVERRDKPMVHTTVNRVHTVAMRKQFSVAALCTSAMIASCKFVFLRLVLIIESVHEVPSRQATPTWQQAAFNRTPISGPRCHRPSVASVPWLGARMFKTK